jgi:predicted enzyme related to lactoylglutathione lyase
MKMNPVMHFQVPVGDMARAQKFYERIFGWQIQAPPEMKGQYHLATTVPTGPDGRPTVPGGINGALSLGQPEGKRHAWLVIVVDSIAEHVKKITAAGGKLLQEKAPVMDMGFYAEVADTEGNTIGLWELAKK